MVSGRNEYRPNHVTPPGATLAETIRHYGMSQAELATRTGLSEKHVNQIIKGKAPISQDTAVSLERALGIDAIFWINRDARYQEHLARERDRERLIAKVSWIQRFPYAEMMERKWIPYNEDKLDILQSLLKFFGVSCPKSWQGIWEEQVAFRKSPAYEADPYSVAAWLRKGWIEAQKIDCNPYNRENFKAALNRIRKLTRFSFDDVKPNLIDECANNGVALVLIKELNKTRASGSARWISKNKACIQLSDRHKTNDQFWFSFFHEAAHILFHGKKEVCITRGDDQDPKEQDANDFAANFLIPQEDYIFLIGKGKPRLSDIEIFAERIGVAPGIVVGRLQREGIIDYKVGNGLKERVSLA